MSCFPFKGDLSKVEIVVVLKYCRDFKSASLAFALASDSLSLDVHTETTCIATAIGSITLKQ